MSVRALCLFGKTGGEPLGRLIDTRLEAPGAALGTNRDLALLVDNENTIGPGVVGFAGGVVEVVHQTRQLDVELGHTLRRDRFTVAKRFGRVDCLFILDGNGPRTVGGVGLLDVDDVELGRTCILRAEIVQGANLAPKRRSRIAAEDEHNRLLALEGRQLDCLLRVEALQLEVGCVRTE